MGDSLLENIQSPTDLKRLDIEQLEPLAEEVRGAICDQVSQTGGHLAPNLGVVELTIALHYVFDFGHDRLLFDVGHQCYPHKLLTGRFGMLSKLRKAGGMATKHRVLNNQHNLGEVQSGRSCQTALDMQEPRP